MSMISQIFITQGLNRIAYLSLSEMFKIFVRLRKSERLSSLGCAMLKPKCLGFAKKKASLASREVLFIIHHPHPDSYCTESTKQTSKTFARIQN